MDTSLVIIGLILSFAWGIFCGVMIKPWWLALLLAGIVGWYIPEALRALFGG